MLTIYSLHCVPSTLSLHRSVQSRKDELAKGKGSMEIGWSGFDLQMEQNRSKLYDWNFEGHRGQKRNVCLIKSHLNIKMLTPAYAIKLNEVHATT